MFTRAYHCIITMGLIFLGSNEIQLEFSIGMYVKNKWRNKITIKLNISITFNQRQPWMKKVENYMLTSNKLVS